MSNGGSEIRVWSAGCAAAQESYSVAILLNELRETSGKDFSFRIFATDISQEEIAKGTAGIFDAASLQNVRLKHLQRYFKPEGEEYAVVQGLKERLEFSTYDLLDRSTRSPSASVYGDFDLIICSNLLIYYRPQVRAFILDKLYRSLSPDGYLVLGEAEREFVGKSPGLQPVFAPAAVYRKRVRLP